MQSLHRGLMLLEAVDLYGPLTLAELTRELDWDKGSVSRTVTSCAAEGWLVRDGSLLRLGPRAALLGRDNAAAAVAREADVLVHAVAGVTGLPTQAYLLAGDRGAVIASAAAPGRQAAQLRAVRMPLWASAAGKVLASQVDPDTIRTWFPTEALPDASELATLATPREVRIVTNSLPADPASAIEGSTTLARTRTELERQLSMIREQGLFIERGELIFNGGCIAVPWPLPGLVGAIACIGALADVEHDRSRIERTLRAATRPGATRESIVTAAAKRN